MTFRQVQDLLTGHKTSSGLVRETSRGIKHIFGEHSAIGGLGAHWQDMADKDYKNEGRWARNTAIGVASVFALMYGAGAMAGESSSGYIGVGSSPGSGAGGGFGEGAAGQGSASTLMDYYKWANRARSVYNLFQNNPRGTGGSYGGNPAVPTAATTTSQDPWQGVGDPWTNTSDPQARVSSVRAAQVNNPSSKRTIGPYGTSGPVKTAGTGATGPVSGDTGVPTSGTGDNMSFLGNLLHGGGNPISMITGGGGGGGGGGGLPGSPFGGGLGMLFGNVAAGGAATDAERAAAMNDPFGGQRSQYQTQLNYLMANPSSVQSQPGYQAEYDASLQATQRQLAASGNTNSGLAMTTMAQVGPQLQQQYYSSQFNRLALLSGAQLSPQDPGGTYLRGRAPVQQAGQNFFGAMMSKLPGLFGQGGGASPDANQGSVNLFEGLNPQDWAGNSDVFGGGLSSMTGDAGQTLM